jgi:hypothetical protein
MIIFSTEDLLTTLSVCRGALPINVHPVHLDRLERIQQIVEIYGRQVDGLPLERRLCQAKNKRRLFDV